jgi:hypothetical protein
MILETVRDKLAATTNPALGLVKAQNLFINGWPADNREGVMLRHYFGGVDYDHEKPGWRQTTFQVITRAPSYAVAETLAKNIITALTIQTEQQVGTLWIKYMRPRAEPFPFPEAPSKLNEFLVNFDVCYVVG